MIYIFFSKYLYLKKVRYSFIILILYMEWPKNHLTVLNNDC